MVWKEVDEVRVVRGESLRVLQDETRDSVRIEQLETVRPGRAPRVIGTLQFYIGAGSEDVVEALHDVAELLEEIGQGRS